MAMAYNTLAALPRLLSYKQASDWEANTKPIRGDANGTKPLGKRTQKYISIKREEDESIALVYGSHTFIRYKPDGDVLIYDQGYSVKASLNELIQTVTTIRTWTENGMCWVRADGKTSYLRPNPRGRWVFEQNAEGESRHRHVPPTTPIPDNIFRRVEDERGMEHWRFINPPTFTKHVINRAAKKRVMETYTPFMRYLDAMNKLLKGEPLPSIDEYVRVFDINVAEGENSYAIRSKLPPSPADRWFNHEHADKLATLMASDDLAHHYKAMLWLWRSMYGADNRPEAVRMAQKVIMMTHHDEILERQEIETDRVARDAYAWAIPPISE